MSGVLIANKDETITISAPDVYGANFSISIFSQESKEWVVSNQTMFEYKETIMSASTLISSDALKDDETIEVEDASVFYIGDIILISSYIYRIINIVDNIISLHISLRNNLYISTLVKRTGNLSLYYAKVNLSEIGDYIIRAKAPADGLEITDSLKVVPKSIETMANEIKTLEYAILGS